MAKTASMASRTLGEIIRDQPPGTWVAVSMDQKAVVGMGPTPDEAKLVGMAQGELEVILLRVPQRKISAPRL